MKFAALIVLSVLTSRLLAADAGDPFKAMPDVQSAMKEHEAQVTKLNSGYKAAKDKLNAALITKLDAAKKTAMRTENLESASLLDDRIKELRDEIGAAPGESAGTAAAPQSPLVRELFAYANGPKVKAAQRSLIHRFATGKVFLRSPYNALYFVHEGRAAYIYKGRITGSGADVSGSDLKVGQDAIHLDRPVLKSGAIAGFAVSGGSEFDITVSEPTAAEMKILHDWAKGK